ncbi:MAG: response regulator transcription factor [Streptosporangiaceae bacterium]
MVVDDSEPFRRSVGELLAARGFEPVDSVPDGETALAWVSGGCPDGILLDINLPGRDGFSVAASLASMCPAAAIVLTSSEIDDVPRVVLRDCGAAAFVPKLDLATADLSGLFTRQVEPGQD